MTRVFACALLAVTAAACSDLIDDPRDGFPTVDTGAVADAGDAALDATIDTPEPGDTGDASKVDAGDSGADAPLPDIPEPPPPTFDDLVGLLSVECAPCHTDRVSGELSLRDDAGLYDRLLTTSFQAPDVARVEPGDPDASYLWLKLQGRQGEVGGLGERMPADGALNADQLDLVQAWILAGAPGP